jgi:WD40 repeat protein
MKVKCLCPHCNTVYSVPEVRLGRRGKCCECGSAFTIELPAEDIRRLPSDTDTGGCNIPLSHDQTAEDTHRLACDTDTGSLDLPLSTTESSTQLGRFEIRGTLGTGAFGTVHRAYDPMLQREVALKVPHPGRCESEEDKTRVLREAKAAGQLRHPNIVPVYDAGMDAGRFYIVSAFIEGKTLEEAVATEPLSLNQAARIVMQLAGALHYAHHLGIIHRDVKPGNIMVDGNGEPQLMDFGLAHVKHSQSQLTHEGAVLGTPAYMSPEQAVGRHNQVGPTSDQYSLGVVLYRLMCGQTPFSGGATSVMFHVINKDPAAPRLVNPQIPKDLETICLKAMSKEPRNRYTSCESFADDLRRYLAGDPILARRMGLPERLWRWCKRNRLLAGCILTTAISLALLAIASSINAMRNAALSEREAVARMEAETNLKRATSEADRADQNLKSARLASENATKEATAARITSEKLWEKTNELEKKTAEAVQARADSEAAARKAEDASSLAAEKAAIARAAQDKEKTAAEEARQSRDQAAHEAERRRQLLYVAEMGSAYESVKKGDAEAARDLLIKYYPTAGNEDLRGFEWYFMWSMVHRGWRLDRWWVTDLASSLTLSPDGRQVATYRCLQFRNPRDLFNVQYRSFLEISALESPNAVPAHTTLEIDVADRIACEAGILAVGSSSVPPAPTLLRPDEEPTKCWTTLYSPAGRVGVIQSRVLKSFPRSTLGSPLHISLVTALALSHDGTLIAIAYVDQPSVFVSSLPQGGTISLECAGPVCDLCFDPFQPRLAMMTANGLVEVWDTAHSEKKMSTRLDESTSLGSRSSRIQGGVDLRPRYLAFSPRGRTLLVSRSDGRLSVIRIDDGQELFTVEALNTDRPDVAFSPDGSRFIGVYANGEVGCWNSQRGDAVYSTSLLAQPRSSLSSYAPALNAVPTTGPACVSIDQHARTIAFLSNGLGNSTVTIWRSAEREVHRTLRGHRGELTHAAMSADANVVATAGTDKKLAIWGLDNREPRFLAGREMPVSALAVSPDGSTLAEAEMARSGIHVWNIARRKRIATLEGHAEGVTGLLISPDGKTLASAGRDRTVRLWDIENKQAVATFEGHEKEVTCTAFSADMRTLASGDRNGNLRLWDILTKDLQGELAGHNDEVTCVAFGRNNEQLVSGSWDSSVRVWDVAAKSCIHVLKGHDGPVYSIAVSPDGRTIASGGKDGTLRIWDATVGQARLILTQRQYPFIFVGFSEDGQTLVSGCADGDVQIWCGEKTGSEPSRESTLGRND